MEALKTLSIEELKKLRTEKAAAVKQATEAVLAASKERERIEREITVAKAGSMTERMRPATEAIAAKEMMWPGSFESNESTPKPSETPEEIEHMLTGKEATSAETLPTGAYETFKTQFSRKHEALGNLATSVEENIPGFNTLDQGTRMLIVEAMANRLYKEVSDTAKATLVEKMNDTGALGRVQKGNGVLGALKHTAARALGGGINALRYGLRKNALTEQYQQDALHTIATSKEKLSEFIEAHAGIARVLAEKEQHAYLGEPKKKGGERPVYIDYIGMEGLSEYGTYLAGEYNKRAKHLQNLPHEFSESDANKPEQRAYQEALERLEIITPDILAILKARSGGDELEASLTLAKARLNIEAMSFLTQHPNAADALRAIATRERGDRIDRGIVKFWKDKFTGDNLKYMIGRVGARTALRAGVGYAVAGTALAGTAPISLPITAALIGGSAVISAGFGALRGKDRAEEGFRIDKRRAQGGSGEQKDTLSQMMEAGRGTKRLVLLTEQLESLVGTTEEEKIFDVSRRLKARLQYTKEKLSTGEINFGTEAERFAREHALITALHRGTVVLETLLHEKKTDEVFMGAFEVTESDEARGRELFTALGKKVTEAQRQEIRKQAFKSAAFGAAFGTVGSFFSAWIRNIHTENLTTSRASIPTTQGMDAARTAPLGQTKNLAEKEMTRALDTKIRTEKVTATGSSTRETSLSKNIPEQRNTQTPRESSFTPTKQPEIRGNEELPIVREIRKEAELRQQMNEQRLPIPPQTEANDTAQKALEQKYKMEDAAIGINDTAPNDPYVSYGHDKDMEAIDLENYDKSIPREDLSGGIPDQTKNIPGSIFEKERNTFFPTKDGLLGTHRPEWNAIKKMNARRFFNTRGIARPETSEFQKVLKEQSTKYSVTPGRGESLQHFARRVFEKMEKTEGEKP
jgi:hypothetical protein